MHACINATITEILKKHEGVSNLLARLFYTHDFMQSSIEPTVLVLYMSKTVNRLHQDLEKVYTIHLHFSQ